MVLYYIIFGLGGFMCGALLVMFLTRDDYESYGFVAVEENEEGILEVHLMPNENFEPDHCYVMCKSVPKKKKSKENPAV